MNDLKKGIIIGVVATLIIIGLLIYKFFKTLGGDSGK